MATRPSIRAGLSRSAAGRRLRTDRTGGAPARPSAAVTDQKAGHARPATPSDHAGSGSGGAAVRFYEGATLTRDASIGWLMKQIMGCMHRELHERMSAIGVTSAQWPLLLTLEMSPNVTAADLARAMSMDAGAMTRMLDRLVDKGLVERHRCDADRRALRLSLTAEGRRAVGPVNDVLAQTLNDVLQGFTRAEFETLRTLLRRLLANARALSDGAERV